MKAYEAKQLADESVKDIEVNDLFYDIIILIKSEAAKAKYFCEFKHDKILTDTALKDKIIKKLEDFGYEAQMLSRDTGSIHCYLEVSWERALSNNKNQSVTYDTRFPSEV